MSDALSGLVLSALVMGFTLGSIPVGLIVGKLFYGIDIRTQGSGNVGAANAARAFGRAGGIAVLALDALKGYAVPALLLLLAHGLGPSGGKWDATHASSPMWLTPTMYLKIPIFLTAAAIGGLAAVGGHCFSPWLRFRGGKGVATHLGVIFALSWQAGLIFIAIWILLVATTGFSSLGSIVATLLTIAALAHFADVPGGVYGLAAAVIIIWRHRENIARLRTGTERKLFATTQAPPAA